MAIDVQFCGPKISDDQLRDFERQRQITLPADYRNFLLQANGGVPSPNCFPFRWGEADAYAHVGRFLGLGYPAAMYSFEWNMRVQERISPTFFIISKDHTGTSFHLVCLELKNAAGSVYYLPQYDGEDPTTFAEDDARHDPDYPTSYFVADSFTAFLKLLTDPPPGLFGPDRMEFS